MRGDDIASHMTVQQHRGIETQREGESEIDKKKENRKRDSK